MSDWCVFPLANTLSTNQISRSVFILNTKGIIPFGCSEYANQLEITYALDSGQPEIERMGECSFRVSLCFLLQFDFL